MKISNKTELDQAILELEKRKVIQHHVMMEQFREFKESIKPINLIKSNFKKLTDSPDIKEGLIKTIAGFGMGALSKKLFLGSSPGMIKKVLSGVMELAVAKTTISNADKVKAYGISIFNNLFRKNGTH